ncbi:MAG: beta-xylosidase [Acidobacteria bacterium]|nr:beta-xylosidase [Acidobacteriota bacterium]
MLAPLALLITGTLLAQDTVRIRVDAASDQGAFRHVWNFFGYDEPNYTYMQYGPKLLTELGRLSPVPVYIRTHNLLTTGDGTAALKWGSTNAYTEDASGKPVYDWTILDRIFDTFQQAGVKPLVEIGFMPKALSTNPEPYQHDFPQTNIKAGWAYPPKDFSKWGELVYQWVRHCVERYGAAEVESWYWEVWNEPDIVYWQGTREEYFQLYEHAARALKRALARARIGGPHSTGPVGDRAADFLRAFLDHTSRNNIPLDYIAFHPKGQPEAVAGHVRMGIRRQLQSIDRGFQIVASFPKYKNTPVILGESDPEGCAACGMRTHPRNAYRNGPLYSSYTAVTTDRTIELAQRHGVNLAGIVTWAFEFEDQPYFDGFRTLATHGIDKPVLNTFRMLALMGGTRIDALSSHRLDVQAMLQSGVREKAEISALATRGERSVTTMIWNYHDDDIVAPPAGIDLTIAALPASQVRVEHFRIDAHTSNAHTIWQLMGRPQSPAPEQYARLEAAGQLQLLTSPEWRHTKEGQLALRFALPRQGVSLLRVAW